MSGKKSRDKGGRGEREVYKLLQPIVNECYSLFNMEPPLMQRNACQSRDGGYDIIGVDWIAIEVKRQETLHIETWWKQTVTQAGENKEPVLIYRKNHQPWQVIMYIYDSFQFRVTISIEDFLRYFKTKTLNHLEMEKIT